MMTNEKAELINTLIDIEERIDELWDYHPDNPNKIDVVENFESLQKIAILLQAQLEELGGDDEDRI